MTKPLALLSLSLLLAATSAPVGAQERLPEAWLAVGVQRDAGGTLMP
jgi:hypothetical protein